MLLRREIFWILTPYSPIPFPGFLSHPDRILASSILWGCNEALQIGELLLSKPVGYMERKFGEFFPLALDLLQNTLQIYSFSIYC